MLLSTGLGRLIALLGASLIVMGCVSSPQRGQRPPEVTREFRGVWVATVANIDWPTETGLTTQQQQQELIEIFDIAKKMNLNAVIFQVRTSADALYESPIEPWSAYLSGTQGQAPDPAWDPLEFAVQAAHERGIELHAWINPLRASHPSNKGELTDNHVSKTMPEAVHQYGSMLWMDPGHPETLKHTMRVVEDIVARYDIDGLHIDDYFYPYPASENGQKLDFPDEATYNAYREAGGKLSRGDWRRENVNVMVYEMHRRIKKTKPYVKFGISPFGIWRPGYPEFVKGMDQYDAIYADAKLWFEKGWCDYFTPQLYWKIAKPDQSFVGLLEWWNEQNPKGRFLWPGLFTSRTEDGSSAAFDANEIGYQVTWSRSLLPDDEPGHVHFSMKALRDDKAGLRTSLSKTAYAKPALSPEVAWLKPEARLKAPGVSSVAVDSGRFVIDLDPASLEGTLNYAAQAQTGPETWAQAIEPSATSQVSLELPQGEGAEAAEGVITVWVTAYDRNGHASPAAVIAVPADQPDQWSYVSLKSLGLSPTFKSDRTSGGRAVSRHAPSRFE